MVLVEVAFIDIEVGLPAEVYSRRDTGFQPKPRQGQRLFVGDDLHHFERLSFKNGFLRKEAGITHPF
ncbi:hypothetical protein D1872_300680 [compost metagenome]